MNTPDLILRYMQDASVGGVCEDAARWLYDQPSDATMDDIVRALPYGNYDWLSYVVQTTTPDRDIDLFREMQHVGAKFWGEMLNLGRSYNFNKHNPSYIRERDEAWLAWKLEFWARFGEHVEGVIADWENHVSA